MRNLASAVISGAPPIASAGRCTIFGARNNVQCTVEYAPNIGFLDVGEQLRNACFQLVEIWFDHNTIFPGLTFTLTKQPDGDWNIEISVASAPPPAPAPTAGAAPATDGWDQDSEFQGLDDYGGGRGQGGYQQPQPGYQQQGGYQQQPGGYQDAGYQQQQPGGGGFQNAGGYQNSPGAQNPGGYVNQHGAPNPEAPPGQGGYQNAGGYQDAGGFQDAGEFQDGGYDQQTGDYQDDSQQGDDQDEEQQQQSTPRKPRGAARGGMVSTKPQANPQKIKMILISVAAFILLVGAGTGLFFLLTQKKAVQQEKTFEETRKSFETNISKHAEAPQEYNNTAPDQVKVVEYPSGDRKLMAWLVLPDREPPFPAVVFAHDGFALSRADYTSAVPFVSHGFAVLIPSWRGENGNPGDFEMCYGEVDDLVAAIDYMASRKKIDKDSIFAAGHGVGATNVMLAAELSPHLRKAAACGGRPDMFEAGEAYEHAPFDQRNAEERLMRSPQQFLNDLKCPMLLLYGDKDPGHKFFLEQAKKMEKESKNHPVLVEELPGVTHQTALAPAIQRMITFFNAR
jgi:dienelactone hydrolase